MPENIIERSWEVFCKVQHDQGSPPPDEVSFVGGFVALFGILTGRVDVGLDQNAPLTDHFDLIQRNVEDIAGRIYRNKMKEN